MEIPTYFVPTKSIKNFVKYYFDKHLKKYVHRIVTDCNEQCIFGIPTIMITNGVDIEKIIPRTPTYDECINVALVASISDYHGVNKIISAVEKEKVDRNIIFHIVGDGPKLKEYRDQIKEKHLEKSVVLYGKLTGQELDAVFNKCELGISSLANKEIGVLFSSTLKSKEYLSKGLPIISDVMLDVFYDNPKFYFYQLQNDFNLRELIDFYDSVYGERDKQNIINEIRAFAEKTCDISNVFRVLDDDYNMSKKGDC